MKKYPAYKERRDWVKEIPSEWDAIKFKFVANIETGSTPPKVDNSNYEGGNILFVKPDELNGFTPIIDSKEKITKKALENSRLIKEFSLLTCAIGTIGKFGIAGSNCITNQQINSFTFNPEKINPKFGVYSFIASEDEQWKNSTTNVVAIINKTSQSRIFIPYPSLREQHSIVRFLDYKTGQIDRFIASRQKQIELLKEQKAGIINKAVTKGIDQNVKLKASGIGWIGDIPEHWEIWKIKHTSYIKGRIGWDGLRSDEFFENEYAFLVTGTDFINGTVNWKTCYQITKERYLQDKHIQLREDDLLITKDGTIGKTAVVKGLKGFASLNSGVFVVRPLRKYKSDFLYFILNSNVFTQFINITTTGTTILHLYQNVFEIFEFTIPPIDEQQAIIDYINKETSTIDTLITKYQKQIDLMQEYRTSLISQAVTGKIDVRGWEAKKKENQYGSEERPLSIAAEN